MNGALVIPKLMCIKFYRAEVERMKLLAQNHKGMRLKNNKKKPRLRLRNRGHSEAIIRGF